MEGKNFNSIQKKENGTPAEISYEAKSLPDISFIPAELLSKESKKPHLFHDLRETCATASIVFGGISVVSWVVILFGLLASISGVVLAIIGLRSNGSKYARMGLGLSCIGFVATVLYIFAAYQGMINYNYFTSEFWV